MEIIISREIQYLIMCCLSYIQNDYGNEIIEIIDRFSVKRETSAKDSNIPKTETFSRKDRPVAQASKSRPFFTNRDTDAANRKFDSLGYRKRFGNKTLAYLSSFTSTYYFFFF